MTEFSHLDRFSWIVLQNRLKRTIDSRIEQHHWRRNRAEPELKSAPCFTLSHSLNLPRLRAATASIYSNGKVHPCPRRRTGGSKIRRDGRWARLQSRSAETHQDAQTPLETFWGQNEGNSHVLSRRLQFGWSHADPNWSGESACADCNSFNVLYNAKSEVKRAAPWNRELRHQILDPVAPWR